MAEVIGGIVFEEPALGAEDTLGAEGGVDPFAEGFSFAAEVGGKADAIYVEVVGEVDLGDFADGGEDVGDVDEFEGFPLSFDDTGPAGDEGDAGAHLCGLALSVATGAIVADEDHEGILTEAKVIEAGDDAADAAVHVFDVGPPIVFGVLGFFFEGRVLVRGGPEGGVCESHGVVDKEGVVFVIGHEVDDEIDEHVGAVAFGGGGDVFAIADDGGVPEAGGFAGVVFPHAGVFGAGGEIVFVGPHHVVVEAGFVDEGGMFAGELPFTGVGGGVSGVLEDLAEGGVVGDVIGAFVGDGRAAGAIGEVVDTIVMGVLPGHDGEAGGVADGVGVTSGEVDAVVGELIEVGRLVDGVAVDAEFVGADIVGEDDDDIGWRRGGSGVLFCGLGEVEAVCEGQESAGGEEEA